MFDVYYNDHYVVPLPETHPFPIRKYSALRDALLNQSIISPAMLKTPKLATEKELTRVHSSQYVENVFTGKLSQHEVRRLGFPWSPELVLRARASVGGTMAASRSALTTGLSGTLAGGTHHAHRDFGSGFCVFNDIAVCIETLRAEGLIGRALVVDLDVHQGDGTAAIFESDRSVFTFSVHNAKNFPVKKATSDLDIGLEDGTDDDAYLEILNANLTSVIERSDPEIIYYQAGVDSLITDKWGRLKLTHGGLVARDRLVIETARLNNVPIVLTLGGGYSVPIEHTIEAHCNTYRVAVELFAHNSKNK